MRIMIDMIDSQNVPYKLSHTTNSLRKAGVATKCQEHNRRMHGQFHGSCDDKVLYVFLFEGSW